MSRRFAILLTCILAGDAVAAPERTIYYYTAPIAITHAYAFTYEIGGSMRGSAGAQRLAVKIDDKGVLESTLDGATAKVQLPKLGTKPAWNVSEWLLGPAPKEPALKAAYTLLFYSAKFMVTAQRSEWEDGFAHKVSYGSLTVKKDACKVGTWSGRQVVAAIEKGLTVEACVSPDVAVPLRFATKLDQGTVEMTLASYAGPPREHGPNGWYCDADCGPKPRRPPPLAAPAPAFRASRWIPAVPIDVSSSANTVLVVQSCFLDEADCRTTAQQIDAIRAKHPGVLAVTLASEASRKPGSKVTADAMVKSFGAKHAIGLQTAGDAAATEDAYDLDVVPTAWVIANGKLAWYGTWRWKTWMPGNATTVEALGLRDAAGLEKAVEAALGKAAPSAGPSEAQVKQIVITTFRARLRVILDCFEVEHAKKPSLAGGLSVRVTFTLDAKQQRLVAGDVKLASSTVADPVVEACVIKVFEKMTSRRLPSSMHDLEPFTTTIPVAFTK